MVSKDGFFMNSIKKEFLRENFTVKSVGYVNSAYLHYTDVFNRHTRKGWTSDYSKIILYPEHAAKLKGLEGFSHIIIIFWIHKSKDWRMPKNSSKPPHIKLFATRMPVRPNPIGLSVVKLVDFSPEKGELKVKGLDALDKTPILDIKPYIVDFDCVSEASIPSWLEAHMQKHHNHNSNHHHHHHHVENE